MSQDYMTMIVRRALVSATLTLAIASMALAQRQTADFTNDPLINPGSPSYVDGFDYMIWSMNRFTVLPGPDQDLGDANLDGIVDGLDFIDWNAQRYTAVGAGTANVPDSAYLGLATLAPTPSSDISFELKLGDDPNLPGADYILEMKFNTALDLEMVVVASPVPDSNISVPPLPALVPVDFGYVNGRANFFDAQVAFSGLFPTFSGRAGTTFNLASYDTNPLAGFQALQGAGVSLAFWSTQTAEKRWSTVTLPEPTALGIVIVGVLVIMPTLRARNGH